MTISPKTGRAGTPAGFTLMEMVVTISVVLLIASISLPSIVSLFSAGAGSQASNLLAGQLVMARAKAIQMDTYVCVHVQMADDEESTGRPNLANTCWAAVMVYMDDGTGTGTRKFILPEGYPPRRMPGNVAFGELSDTFVKPNGDYRDIANLGDFTTFTIVFDPSGAVVRRVEGQTIDFDTSQALFSGGGGGINRLWNPSAVNGEDGVIAVTMFDYPRLRACNAADRKRYLNLSGQFLAVNVHSGQLFTRR